MKVMGGLAMTVDSDRWQHFSHQLPRLKQNQPYGVWHLQGGQEQPIVNIALVFHTSSNTVNCHQPLHKQVTPKQNPAQQFQQPSPSKFGNALSAMNGTIIQHHTVLFQGVATDVSAYHVLGTLE